MRECFANDTKSAYEDGHYSFEDVDAIMQFLQGSLGGSRRVRAGMPLGHHGEMRLTSPTTAGGTWLLNDDGGGLATHYPAEHAKIDGRWKIKSTGDVRIFWLSWQEPGLRAAEDA